MGSELRASLECVEPNELREWMDWAREAVASRGLSRDDFRAYDTARRFLASPEQVTIQTETWLTREDCYSLARLELRRARIWLGRAWDGIGPVQSTPEHMLEAVGHIVEAARMRELARGKWPAEHSYPRYDERRSNLHDHPVHDPSAVARPVVVEPDRPLARRKTFDGQWHWDDARASIDAAIASLPEGHRLAARLEHIEIKARADSTLVYRWGVALAEWHGLDEPWRYGSALTDSVAIHRPSLAVREAIDAGLFSKPSFEETEWWREFRDRARSAAGLPLDDERGA